MKKHAPRITAQSMTSNDYDLTNELKTKCNYMQSLFPHVSPYPRHRRTSQPLMPHHRAHNISNHFRELISHHKYKHSPPLFQLIRHFISFHLTACWTPANIFLFFIFFNPTSTGVKTEDDIHEPTGGMSSAGIVPRGWQRANRDSWRRR